MKVDELKTMLHKRNLKPGQKFPLPLPITLANRPGRPVEGTPWVEFDFRLLTGRYLGESGYFLDFSTPGVLTSALPLFRMQNEGGVRTKPLKYQRNHSYEIQDTLGYSLSVEASIEDGIEQITGVARLHRDLAAREIEMLSTDPPLLESISLSLAFDWVQSHPEMRWWQFIDLLGHEVDGQIVRIIVTEILEIYHIALVWNGADEQAVKLAQANLWKNAKGDFSHLDLTNSKEGEATMLEKLLKKFNLTSEEEIDERIENLLAAEARVAELETKIGALETNLQELNANKPLIEIGMKYLKNLKTEVKGLAGLVLGQLSDSMTSLIDAADLTKLEALRQEFNAKAAELFPAKCQDCGSTNVSLRSSREESKPAPVKQNETQFKIK